MSGNVINFPQLKNPDTKSYGEYSVDLSFNGDEVDAKIFGLDDYPDAEELRKVSAHFRVIANILMQRAFDISHDDKDNVIASMVTMKNGCTSTWLSDDVVSLDQHNWIAEAHSGALQKLHDEKHGVSSR